MDEERKRIAPKSIRRLKFELREAEKRVRFWLDRRFSGESPSKRLAALNVVNELREQLKLEPAKMADFMPPEEPAPKGRKKKPVESADGSERNAGSDRGD